MPRRKNPLGSSSPVVILDRDGTINVERHYLSRPDQVELLPGAAVGMRRLQRRGHRLVVVTNQSGIARGYFDENRLEKIHQRLMSLLEAEGVGPVSFYYCPHHPDEGCSCRKPAPGLILQAADELGFDPKASIVIGDKPCDIELGHAVGARTVLVATGYGAFYQAENYTADYYASTISDAADVVLSMGLSSDTRMLDRRANYVDSGLSQG